jgi:hypothetical protein
VAAGFGVRVLDEAPVASGAGDVFVFAEVSGAGLVTLASGAFFAGADSAAGG